MARPGPPANVPRGLLPQPLALVGRAGTTAQPGFAQASTGPWVRGPHFDSGLVREEGQIGWPVRSARFKPHEEKRGQAKFKVGVVFRFALWFFQVGLSLARVNGDSRPAS